MALTGCSAFPQSSSIAGTSSSDCLVSYPGYSLGGGLTPLQSFSRCILQPQPLLQWSPIEILKRFIIVYIWWSSRNQCFQHELIIKFFFFLLTKLWLDMAHRIQVTYSIFNVLSGHPTKNWTGILQLKFGHQARTNAYFLSLLASIISSLPSHLLTR